MNNFTNTLKSAVVLLLSATSLTPATAQIHFDSSSDGYLYHVPNTLQCNGKAKMFSSNADYYGDSGDAGTFFKILDDNFQIEKEFSWNTPSAASKTVYQQRKVNGYTDTLLVYNVEEYYGSYWETGKSLEEFCAYYNALLIEDHGDNAYAYEPEDIMIIKGIFFLSSDSIGIPTIDDQNISIDGITYNPQSGLIIRGELWRHVTLSDQWETIKEEENNWFTYRVEVVDYDNLDKNTFSEVYLSQNFFNNDEKYEFIVPFYARSEEGYINYTDYLDGHYGEEEFAYERTINYDSKLKSFQVINEDGNIIHEFEPTASYSWVEMFTFNNKNYLICDWQEEGREGSDIYEINNQTNDIQKVQQFSNFSIQPRTPHRNEPINVELLENKADTNLEVLVTAADGRTAYRTTLRAGNKSVRLDTSHLSAGFYNVTVIKNGQKVESAKVIVR